MALSQTVFIFALICSLFAGIAFAQFDEGGCDGLGGEYDSCGVCNGNNECLFVGGCDGYGGSYDDCGVCNGDNDCLGCDGLVGNMEYDECGVCGGFNTDCLGCDGEINSGLDYDDCGVCGGMNACLTCDGEGGAYDKCGICNGDNSTCGGCDGRGGKYDNCGVCDGDNSDCECVKYHGFKIEILDYMLVQYSIDQTLWKIQHILDTLILTMEDLEEYDGPADLGVMILYLNNFCEDCLATYSFNLDKFTYELKQSIGLENENVPFSYQKPYTILPDVE